MRTPCPRTLLLGATFFHRVAFLCLSVCVRVRVCVCVRVHPASCLPHALPFTQQGGLTLASMRDYTVSFCHCSQLTCTRLSPQNPGRLKEREERQSQQTVSERRADGRPRRCSAAAVRSPPPSPPCAAGHAHAQQPRGNQGVLHQEHERRPGGARARYSGHLTPRSSHFSRARLVFS